MYIHCVHLSVIVKDNSADRSFVVQQILSVFVYMCLIARRRYNRFFSMPVNNDYTIVDMQCTMGRLFETGFEAVSKQKTSNCVFMLEAGTSILMYSNFDLKCKFMEFVLQ